jgi:O-6-methylguanine DNA methyltransferase
MNQAKQLEDSRLITPRRVITELRSLHEVEAPSGLAGGILAELGLADRYVPLETPLGRMFVAYNDRGISAVRYAQTAVQFEQEFRLRFGRPVMAAGEAPTWLARALDKQIRGPGRLTLRFDLRGLSEFEQAVLLKALEIPRGEVRTYAWVAREIGRPKAVRAVGNVLAHNPIPLFIPCHRVVKSDGHLGRYSLIGDDSKREILAAEGLDPDALEVLAERGVRYTGSDTTRIFCFPTCRHARRTSEEHVRHFHSEAEALAAGYRPCKVCRPRLEA